QSIAYIRDMQQKEQKALAKRREEEIAAIEEKRVKELEYIADLRQKDLERVWAERDQKLASIKIQRDAEIKILKDAAASRWDTMRKRLMELVNKTLPPDEPNGKSPFGTASRAGMGALAGMVGRVNIELPQLEEGRLLTG